MGTVVGFYSMLTVAFTVYCLLVTGFLKRLYLKTASRYVSLLAVALGAVILTQLSPLSIEALAYVARLSWWAFADVASLPTVYSALASPCRSRRLIYGSARRRPCLQRRSFCYWRCGNFMPAELPPQDMLDAVRLPSLYVARSFAEAAVLVTGLLLHPLVKR